MHPRGVCRWVLKPPDVWEGPPGKCRCCQPDSGNPTVRDERGACGNVSYGGTRIPPHNRKGASRKLSTYGCARRISTRQSRGRRERNPRQAAHGESGASQPSLVGSLPHVPSDGRGWQAIVFEELTSTTARTRHMVLITHKSPSDKHPEVRGTGTYQIEWRKIDEKWLISHRTYYPD